MLLFMPDSVYVVCCESLRVELSEKGRGAPVRYAQHPLPLRTGAIGDVGQKGTGVRASKLIEYVRY